MTTDQTTVSHRTRDAERKPKRNATTALGPTKPPPSDDERSYFRTRLCIRNLPKDVNEDQVRNWLHSVDSSKIKSHEGENEVPITDCRVLRKGRQSMAFVGVTTPELADLVIERFDRTYYRTSRVAVERAYKSLKLQQQSLDNGTTSNSATAVDHAPNEKVTSRSSSLRTNTKTKLLASAAKPTKFWANDAEDHSNAPDVTIDQVETDEESSTSSNSSGVSSDEEDEDERDNQLLHQQVKSKSDLDFLQSIKTSAEDLEQEHLDGDGDSDLENGSTSSDSEVEMKAPTSADKLNGEAGDSSTPHTAQHTQATSRIFVRNLPFSTTEEDLKALFENSGSDGTKVTECHIPVTDQKRPKGFAFVTLSNPNEVSSAIAKLDGCDFQGRILHMMPAQLRPDDPDGDNDGVAPRSYQDKKDLERRKDADGTSQTGLSSFVRSDAVVDTLASRMGFKKGDIMSVKDGLSSGDAAVRLALGETAVIEENRKFLEQRGISLDTGKSDAKRSNTCILVKNLPADTTKEELMKVFGAITATSDVSTFGPSRLDLAPSRTLAVAEYSHRNDAKTAMRRLAYRRFKSVPLYLEWAPMISENQTKDDIVQHSSKTGQQEEVDDTDDEVLSGPTATVHVKNLNFATTEDRLKSFFDEHVKDVRAVRIPQKVVPVKGPGHKDEAGVRSLSMGYGFVEFGSPGSCRKVMKTLQGALLDGHALEISLSSKNQPETISTRTFGKMKGPSKLAIRNVPFQATRKELLPLFGSFGQLKKVRLPKKFDGSHRGFAFVEYLTSKEAESAFRALSSTHLYGRHLVIEWATDDDEDLTKVREKSSRGLEGSSVPTATSRKKARVT